MGFCFDGFGIHGGKKQEVGGDVFGFLDGEERGLRGKRVFL